MPEASPMVFISYSRTDSAFVDRLEATLQSRGFRTWVDRSEMRGGVDWLNQIQDALDQCQAVLVILSPVAVQSEYVQMEYRYAKSQGKPIVPLEYQALQRVPIDLHALHRIIFHNNYDQGFESLLHTLRGLAPSFATSNQTNDQAHRQTIVSASISNSDAKNSEAEAFFAEIPEEFLALFTKGVDSDDGLSVPETPPSPSGPHDTDDSFDGNFAEIFEQFFGGSIAHTRQDSGQRGANIHYELTISFEEAVFGCQKVIVIPRWENCWVCGGSGARPGTQTQRCSNCQGTGEIRQAHQSIFGQGTNAIVCNRCQGEGNVITTPCIMCRGQRRILNRRRRVIVNIPAGVYDGFSECMTGEGEISARGGTPGNLYVSLTVKSHPIFKRQGTSFMNCG